MRVVSSGRLLGLVVASTVACAGPASDPSRGRVEGVVRDAFTSIPLAGARVTLDRDGLTVTADAEGRFALDAPEGAHTFVVRADGHFDLERLELTVAGGAVTRSDVELPPTDPSDEAVAHRLALLAEAHAHRDSPDDPGLRPEVAAYLRGEITELPRRAVSYDPDPTAVDGVTRAGQAGAIACTASLSAPPRTIRIWRRAVSGGTSSCRGRVDVIPFEDYIKGVLPHEWIPSWHRESLQAGSLAIRTYSWRWVLAGGKYDCADLDDTTASQVYRSDRLAVTDAAVDVTRAQGILRSGRLVSGEYSAENGNPTADGVSDPLCAGRARQGHGRGMCQWGSSRWASAGRNHAWIATHYWPGSSIGCGGDRDHDGRSDDRDNCPSVSNADQRDTDRDGRGDACDNCDSVDNPGQADRDDDDRGDACDNCPTTRNADQRDTDRDGRGDACDNCDSVDNRDQRDTDRDGQGDACDADDDNDGVADARDNCPLLANRDQADRDRDGHGDACDSDDDGDGVPDATDNCRGVSNRDQADRDHDRMGDACDDGDGDGVLDATDDCPAAANRDQEDLDGDHAGDACDDDDDGDGVADARDVCPREPDPMQRDTDRDGRGDACDDDLDGDGVMNGADNCPEVSNPDQANADDDEPGDACDPEPMTPRPEEDAGFVREPEDASVEGVDAGFEPAPDGGCSCSAAGAVRDGASPLLALAGALALVRRRRPSPRPPPADAGGGAWE